MYSFSNLPLVDLCVNFDYTNVFTLWSRVLTKFGRHRTFLGKLHTPNTETHRIHTLHGFTIASCLWSHVCCFHSNIAAECRNAPNTNSSVPASAPTSDTVHYNNQVFTTTTVCHSALLFALINMQALLDIGRIRMMITIITDEVSECQRTRAYLPYRKHIASVFSLHDVIQIFRLFC